MLPGVTAGGAEGEAPSPARPSSPTSPGPQTARRTLGAARQRRKMSSDSSLLLPSHLPPGKDAAAVLPGSCWHPRAQLCMGCRRAGAVIQAGNWGERWGGSKPASPSPSPPGDHLPGSGFCGTWSIPRIRANGGGAVKDSNREKELWRGREHLPHDRRCLAQSWSAADG